MLAIISLLLIVALSLIVTRTAAVALTYTGLSQQPPRGAMTSWEATATP